MCEILLHSQHISSRILSLSHPALSQYSTCCDVHVLVRASLEQSGSHLAREASRSANELYQSVYPYIWAWGHVALPKSPLYMGMGTLCTAKKTPTYGHGDNMHCQMHIFFFAFHLIFALLPPLCKRLPPHVLCYVF